MPAEQSLKNIFYIGTRHRELGGFIMDSLKYPGGLRNGFEKDFAERSGRMGLGYGELK